MQIIRPAKKKLASCLYIFLLSIPAYASAALAPIPGVPDKSIDAVLNDIISWLLGLGITLCVLMIIWGGINYTASVGDQQRADKAKKTIHYAIWGILIISLSYAMIALVDKVLVK